MPAGGIVKAAESRPSKTTKLSPSRLRAGCSEPLQAQLLLGTEAAPREAWGSDEGDKSGWGAGAHRPLPASKLGSVTRAGLPALVVHLAPGLGDTAGRALLALNPCPIRLLPVLFVLLLCLTSLLRRSLRLRLRVVGRASLLLASVDLLLIGLYFRSPTLFFCACLADLSGTPLLVCGLLALGSRADRRARMYPGSTQGSASTSVSRVSDSKSAHGGCEASCLKLCMQELEEDRLMAAWGVVSDLGVGLARWWD
ncbi:hypothetical protein Efla_004035 [Eimeria flavescens]